MPRKKLDLQQETEETQEQQETEETQEQQETEETQEQQEQTNKENNMTNQEELDKAADTGYVVSDEEKHLVHFELEDVQYDQKSGEKTSVPSLLKEHPNEFKVHMENRKELGLQITILHEPKAE